MISNKVTCFPVVVVIEGDKAHKKPSIQNWQRSSLSYEQVKSKNVGVNIPKNVVIIDLDIYKDGASVEDIETAFNIKFPKDALIQKTISGGLHYALTVPEGVPIRQGSDINGYIGLDTRCHGRGWICTGKGYTIFGADNVAQRLSGPLPPMPKNLLEFLTIKQETKPKQDFDLDNPLVDERTIVRNEVIDALRFVSSENYEQWIRVGMALSKVEGGFDLWENWSKASSKFKKDDCSKRWHTFDDSRICEKTIFYLAQENGWHNPRKMTIRNESYTLPPDGYTPRKYEICSITPKPKTRFVVPGLISEGVAVLASSPGLGKTSATIRIASEVAGAYLLGDLNPGLGIIKKRHVVYFSEHPEQVDSMLSAMVDEGLVDKDKIKRYFHLFSAERVNSGDWKKALDDLMQGDEYFTDVTHNNVTLRVPPWVIIDTSSACFVMTDENSNSEWSSTISDVKTFSNVQDAPVLIVTHVGKSFKGEDDARKMTARGAGSIEGDVMQIMFLVKDKDTDRRYIDISGAKHRFCAEYDYIAIEPSLLEVDCIDEFKQLSKERVFICDVYPCNHEVRVEKAKQVRAVKAMERFREVADDLSAIIRLAYDDKTPITPNGLKDCIVDMDIDGLKGGETVEVFIKDLMDKGIIEYRSASENYEEFQEMKRNGYKIHGKTKRVLIAFDVNKL